MKSRLLNSSEMLSFLAPYEIPFPKQAFVSEVNALSSAAQEIGYPLVLKLISPQATHKSDQQLVVLNIKNEIELYNHVTRLRKSAADLQVDGFLLQQFLRGGLEVLVGTSLDEQFGHTLLFGSGGKLVEWMNDVVIRIPPLNRWQLEDMVNRSRISTLLDGYRDIPVINRQPLIELLAALNKLTMDKCDSLISIDLNPVIVFPDAVFAVDARVFVAEDF